MENIAVTAPIPSANVRIANVANAFSRARTRSAYFILVYPPQFKLTYIRPELFRIWDTSETQHHTVDAQDASDLRKAGGN